MSEKVQGSGVVALHEQVEGNHDREC